MTSVVASRLVAAATISVLVASCSSGSPARDANVRPPPTPTRARTADTSPPVYLALGDSFTAGPGLDQQRDDAGYCQRSRLNWPTLLAAKIDAVEPRDLSCSGATTADLISTVDHTEVDPATDLVTIGIGGNDGGLFVALLRACSLGGEACAPFVDEDLPRILDRTVASIATLVADVKEKASEARIVLVGYPRIMPETGTCDSVRIAPADVATVVRAEVALDEAQAEAAARADIPYVSMRAASAGHDACAGEAAWVNGTTAAPGDGIVFHPRRAGMAAVADVVKRALAEPAR
ncbi:MAG: hypothetical protein JWP31_2714 [Aeromicrobium sp.]|nr:hypothetical protein [Aeromicrobium sp.]